MTELGQTTDALVLIPGSVAALTDAAVNWRSRAETARMAAEELGQVSPPESWAGEAADLFASRLSAVTSAWLKNAQMMMTSADALENYATMLGWAQGKAGDAIDMWETARVRTVESLAPKPRSNQFYGSNVTIEPPPADAGASLRAEAIALLTYARQEVSSAGAQAADTIRAAADIAPPAPDPWQVASAMTQMVVQLAITTQVDTLTNLVNGTASVANALIEHPETILEILGGIGLMAGGGALAVGGLPVAATGVGIVPGGAAVGAGITAAVAGAAATGMGIMNVAQHATGDSAVRPLPGRDAKGRFTSDQEVKPWVDKEKQGIDEIQEEFGVEVKTERTAARIEGSDHTRYFDGFFRNDDGTYTAIEVKSGGATRTAGQREFDGLVSEANPAIVKVDGEIIRVTSVYLKRVP
ncbi:putative T7SS-secreted protein [Microbacterium testaceum]|uniref:putative T7SS-secreted protein n=1 Tax=Microbacterium testaceum TaxID=2033 RepID=UPI0025AF0A4E|nr:hypothetical protein [Microbacterium testaceum]WJS90912.1 hypothetical protein NYQ11_16600 [Microbacterium testaceum]